MRKIAFLVLASFGCWAGQDQCGYHAPVKYRQIFDLPKDQQEAAFKNLSSEDKVEMYLCAMYRHPPDMAYGDFLASGGKAVLPEVLRKLDQVEGDYAKCVLIRVLRDMHQRYYSLHSEEDLIERLRERSVSIRDSFWREESERYIRGISEEPQRTDKEPSSQ